MFKRDPNLSRTTLPTEIRNRVLVDCRRRCCICYGLHRDTKRKRGQIAHLDQNRNNNALDNLAFLCLEHHDEFDGRTSQSKGLTPQEVRQFRKELHEAIERLWQEPVQFGFGAYRPPKEFEGRYLRESEHESAVLEIEDIGEGFVHVRGLAFWGMKNPRGPNIGELEFKAPLVEGEICFEDRSFYKDESYRLKLVLDRNRLTAEEEYVVGYFGMNVSFAGEYQKERRRREEDAAPI